MRTCVGKITLFFCFAVSWGAKALPKEAVLQWIHDTYDPQVLAQEVEEYSSPFENCRKLGVTLTARDPVLMSAGQVSLRIYVDKKINDPAALKTVILIPPTGGENYIDDHYASKMCGAGMRVALVKNWDHRVDAELDMDMYDRSALRALSAVRHTIEYLRPVRASQIGIFGTSLGALISTFALGYESRLAAGVLIVGGIGMAEMISITDEKTQARLRTERMAAFGYKDVDEYRRALEGHIQIDPSDFVDFSSPKPAWMMIAQADTTVPTKNQMDLFNALSLKESATYNSSHVGTILYAAAAHTRKMIDFLNRYLQ